VKDEVSETKLDVGPDLLKMLVRVIRDEPAAVCLVGHSLSSAFHFARIFDACFVLGRKGQGGPDAGIAKCAFPVGIEGYLDLDGSLDGCRVPAGLFRALFDRWQQLIPVEFVAFARGTDETITGAPRELSGNGPTVTEIDGVGLVGRMLDGSAAEPVIFSLVRDERL